MHKKLFCFILILNMILTGCSNRELSLHQPINNIVHVELLRYKCSERIKLCSLEENEIPVFIDSLLALECRKHFSPQGYYGSLVVSIEYLNGDIEYVGSTAMSYFSSDGEDYDGWYYVPYDSLYDLCLEYFDESQIG